MNIGFFSPTINRIGGGEWVTLNMIKSLRARQHGILIYSAETINPAHIQEFFGHKLELGNEVRFWPNLFDPYSLENIYPNLAKSYFFSLKCDYVIDTFSNAIFPWSDAVYFQGKPRILQLPKGMKGSLFVPYKTFLTNSGKHVKSKEKILMACSKYAAKTIETLTGLTVNVLYPPVSDFFKVGHKVSSSPRTDTAVTVVRISNDKRPETIAQIAKLVPDNISFAIVGSCRTSSELDILNNLQKCIHRLGVEGKVKLLINVSRQKQREMLQKSKVYLHPFVPYEAFGISVIEAMSAGCIPIVPDIAGLKEIVPKQLRYNSLEEAASLVEQSITNWCPSKAQDSVAITDNFSQANFQKEFLRIMKLNA